MFHPHACKERIAVKNLRRSGTLAVVNGVLQGADARFMFFKQPQTCPHDLARRSISARVHLRLNDGSKMIANRDRCASTHGLMLLMARRF